MRPVLGSVNSDAEGVHGAREAGAVDHDEGGDGEADHERVLEDRPAPVEARRQLDAEGGDDEDEDAEDRSDEGDEVLVVGGRVAEEAKEVGAERHGEAGRADGVVHQHDPAGEEPGVRVEGAADPGVRGAGARLPGVEPLVADGDADHRDEADEDRQERVIGDGEHQAEHADGDALRRPGAGQRHDHDVADAQRAVLQPLRVVALGRDSLAHCCHLLPTFRRGLSRWCDVQRCLSATTPQSRRSAGRKRWRAVWPEM